MHFNILYIIICPILINSQQCSQPIRYLAASISLLCLLLTKQYPEKRNTYVSALSASSDSHNYQCIESILFQSPLSCSPDYQVAYYAQTSNLCCRSVCISSMEGALSQFYLLFQFYQSNCYLLTLMCQHCFHWLFRIYDQFLLQLLC